MPIPEDKCIILNDKPSILHDADGGVEKEGYIYGPCYKRLSAESLLQVQGHVQEANRQGRLGRQKARSIIRQIEGCLSILQRDCESRVLLMADYLRMGEFLDGIDDEKGVTEDGEAGICGDSEYHQG